MSLVDRFEQSQDEMYDVEIDARRCASDRFDGIEYTFEGPVVDVRSIIEVVRETEGRAIENLHHTNEESPKVTVFVADIPAKEYGFIQ